MKTKQKQYEELTSEGRALQKEFYRQERGSLKREELRTQLIGLDGKVKKRYITIVTKTVNVKRRKKLRTHR